MVRSFSHSKIMHYKHFFDIINIYSFVGCVTCDTSLQLIVGVLNRGEGFPCPMEVRLKVARGPGGAGSDDELQPRLIQHAQVRC